MKIRVLRSASRTVAEGIRFYDRQEVGLGAYFLNSIMSDVRSLSITAGVHQKMAGSYFRLVCTKFPYSIYYRMDDSGVAVYAILDDRQDPERTEDTLGKIDQ
jgi:hypothetical protein